MPSRRLIEGKGSDRVARTPGERLRSVAGGQHPIVERTFALDGGAELAAAVFLREDARRLLLVTDLPALLLHWGVARRSAWEWCPPPAAWLPPGTSTRAGAARTPFVERDGIFELELDLPEAELPLGIPFVLHQVGTDRWIKDGGRNFFIPLSPPQASGDTRLAALVQAIVEREVGTHSWTLMHRFNLCHDLLDGVTAGALDELALIFAWLRFSAIRQLDWQRSYNTQPRELAHAQDRLTKKLALRYAANPSERELIRLILSTVGRGGNGQRVRDEILNIMHRHHIKETSGHFLEEWHQKLHNNATPDDIVICQAYLDFLRSDGDLQAFYRTLQAGDLSRERLRSYERPIRAEPDFHPHLRDGLIHDFTEFLAILKSFHSSIDLATMMSAAWTQLDGTLQGLVDDIWRHRDAPVQELPGQAERVAAARSRLASLLERQGSRDLLYLDLALENHLRQLLEKCPRDEDRLELLCPALRNLCLSYPAEEELTLCLHLLSRLSGGAGPSGRVGARLLHAALERLGRALGSLIDARHRRLQPMAEALGRPLRVADWAIELFTEEVVRGRIEFAVAGLQRRLLTRVRQAAEVGKWLVISRSRARGRVATVAALSSIEGKSFADPVIVIADEVRGDELIPDGVTAVITPSTVDVVSHVAVRARNAGLLLATCFDADTLERLRQQRDRTLELGVSASGEVVEERPGRAGPAPPVSRHQPAWRAPPPELPLAITESDIVPGAAGAKSRTLRHLRGVLPAWVRLPAGVVVPAGTMERLLRASGGAGRYEELAGRAERGREEDLLPVLEELRLGILAMELPGELGAELLAALEQVGLPAPASLEQAWQCIKQVWSSTWSPAAARSRRSLGIPPGGLGMAVLIQEVVPADYSFVIHTVNPLNERADQIYAEVVCGLGETLVGNHPGRALAFAHPKGAGKSHLLSFPSKSRALRSSGGLIFRSDSSGEDLPGYAGAGLYSSLMLPPPRSDLLDYSGEPLIWDERFREELLAGIAALGRLVEEALGRPQDIEGAWAKGTFTLLQARPQVGLDRD